jgi:hypothetical protein
MGYSQIVGDMLRLQYDGMCLALLPVELVPRVEAE